MDLSRPVASGVPFLDGDVLMVLVGTTHPLTGRELSRLVRRGSWSGVRRVMHRFVDQGLVTSQEATPSMLYSLPGACRCTGCHDLCAAACGVPRSDP
jgi:hypothetical protein